MISLFKKPKEGNNPGWLGLLYSVSFVVILIIGFAPFFQSDLSFIWDIDGIGQYYPAFLYIGQYLREFITNIINGRFYLPVYDLSIGMGENIIGCLNYYGFGDPINIIAIFTNNTNGMYIFALRYILGLYLAGVSFCVYARKVGLKGTSAIIPGLIYAFSGFSIDGGLRYYEWISVLFFFPLMLAGIEDIINDKKKWKLFLVSVTYGALCGFYFLYMASLAAAVYCLIRMIWKYRNIRKIIATGCYCLFIYVWGICIASPIFFPAVRAYLNSKRNGVPISEIMNVYLFKPNSDGLRCWLKLSVKPSSFYNYYFGMLLMEWIGVVTFLIFNRTTRVKKLRVGFGLCALSLLFPITGWLFNGFGENNDRWVFIIHFVMAVIFAHFLNELMNHNYFLIRKKVKINGNVLISMVAALCLVNIIANLWWVFTEKGDDWKTEFVTNEDVSLYVDSPVGHTENAINEEFCRISIDQMTEINGRPENVAMINDYYGTTYWFSIVNQYTQQYANQYYEEELKWRSHGFRGEPFTEALAGCKYYLSDKEIAAADYLPMETVTFIDKQWYVYENPYYLGMVYCSDMVGEGFEADKLSLIEYNQLFYPTCTNEGIVYVEYDKEKAQLSCRVNIDQKTKMIFAIPYLPEWKVFVDGKEVPTQRWGMYIAADLSEGQHEIVLKYTDKLFRIAILLMTIGLFGLFIGTALKYRSRKGEIL